MGKLVITKEGHQELQEKLDNLRKNVRPAVISAVADAKAFGDLSENAEYQEARREQSFVESKIMDIEDYLARAEIIDTSKLSGEVVRFGATVTIENQESGDVLTYKIVGDIEANIQEKKISLSSPIGRAIINKKIGDIVEVILPTGEKLYKILSVEFR